MSCSNTSNAETKDAPTRSASACSSPLCDIASIRPRTPPRRSLRISKGPDSMTWSWKRVHWSPTFDIMPENVFMRSSMAPEYWRSMMPLSTRWISARSSAAAVATFPPPYS